jgi:hypothetical protein
MTIAFQCSSCGVTLRVPDAMAGRRGKCPKCGVINSIPDAGGQLQTAPSSRPPKEAPTPEEADGGEEAGGAEETRPRRKGAKKRGNRTLLFVGLGCGALLLLTCLGTGVGVGLWWYLSSPIGDELVYMPNNCEYVAVAKIDELIKSDAFKQVENEVPQFKQAMAVGDAEKEIGLPLSNVERLVIGGPLSNRDEPVVAVRTKQAVKAEDLTAKIKGKTFTPAKEGSYTIYETGGVHGQAFCVVKKNLVLFGSGPALRVVLRRDKKPEMSDNLKAALKELDFKQTVTVAFAPQQSSGPAGAPPLGGRGGLPFGPAVAPPPGMEWGVLHAKVGADVSITVTVQCKSPADASNAKTQTDDSIAKLRQFPLIPKELSGAIDVKTSVNGKKMTATTDIKVAPLLKSIKNMAGPQGMK